MRYVILICVILTLSTVNATWQKTLETEFDIVETFDNLQDWAAPRDLVKEDDPSLQPKTLDGNVTNWKGFTTTDLVDPKDNFIGNHGVNYTWSGSKSLIINPGTLYCEDGDEDDTRMTGYGPGTMYYYWGNGSSESGYTDVRSFYLMKFYPNFFLTDSEGNYRYHATYKGFFLNQGSTGGCSWDEIACHVSAGDYHPSFVYLHYNRLTSSILGFKANIRNATDHNFFDPPEDCIAYASPVDGESLRDMGYTSQYEAREWIAVEIHYVLGQDNDGYFGITLYDEQGNIVGIPQEYINYSTQGDRPFGKINRARFGGNYQCNSNVEQNIINDTRIAYDDFIIDNGTKGPIGPRYFALLDQNHEADLNSDGNISNAEMRSYLMQWRQGTVSITSMIDALRIWKE